MNLKVKEVVKYAGHNMTANGTVNLTLKAAYGELTSTIKLFQMLNNDIVIKAKSPDEPGIKLGSFMIKDIKVDGDGESVLKFNGLNDFIEMDNLNLLVGYEEFVILLETVIEEEEGTDDE